MANYKDMYLKLFVAADRTIDDLKKALLEAEETYINSDQPNLVLMDRSMKFPKEASEKIETKSIFDKSYAGTNIRSLRRKYSMTIDELAAKMGISSAYLGLIERGKRDVTLNTLCFIANFFDVSIDSLLSNSRYMDSEFEATGEEDFFGVGK